MDSIGVSNKKFNRVMAKIEGIEEYFEYQIGRCNRSDHSNVPIPYPNRSNIAHILPKRKYKSVATHKENVMFLTLEEHTNFDNWMDGAQFDKMIDYFSDRFFIILEQRLAQLLEVVEEWGSNARNLKKLIELWKENYYETNRRTI